MSSEATIGVELPTHTCPVCRVSNSAGRRYCVNCGKALFSRCPQCHEECSIHEKYCGHCGAGIQALVDTHRQQIEEAWQKARQLQAEHNYSEAILLLSAATSLAEGHLRLEDHLARTRAKIERLSAERQAVFRICPASSPLGQAASGCMRLPAGHDRARSYPRAIA